MGVDALPQATQALCVALQRFAEPGDVPGQRSTDRLGLHQPACLAAWVVPGPHPVRLLLHKSPHALTAFLHREFLSDPLQGVVVAAHGPIQCYPVSSYLPICSQIPHVPAYLLTRVPAVGFHLLKTVALLDEGVHRMLQASPRRPSQVHAVLWSSRTSRVCDSFTRSRTGGG